MMHGQKNIKLSGPVSDGSRNTSFFPCQCWTNVSYSFIYLSPTLYVYNLSKWQRLGVAHKLQEMLRKKKQVANIMTYGLLHMKCSIKPT